MASIPYPQLPIAVFSPVFSKNTPTVRTSSSRSWWNMSFLRRVLSNYIVVGFSPTQFEKYATVKLDHETPRFGVKIPKIFELPPPRITWEGCVTSFNQCINLIGFPNLNMGQMIPYPTTLVLVAQWEKLIQQIEYLECRWKSDLQNHVSLGIWQPLGPPLKVKLLVGYISQVKSH